MTKGSITLHHTNFKADKGDKNVESTIFYAVCLSVSPPLSTFKIYLRKEYEINTSTNYNYVHYYNNKKLDNSSNMEFYDMCQIN